MNGRMSFAGSEASHIHPNFRQPARYTARVAERVMIVSLVGVSIGSGSSRGCSAPIEGIDPINCLYDKVGNPEGNWEPLLTL
jgi:hypothetical protein